MQSPPVVARSLTSSPVTRRWSLAALIALAAASCQRPAGPAAAESTAASPVTSVAPAPAAKPPEAPAAPQSHEPAVAVGHNGAVSSAEGTASDVGIEIMKKGGNAVDAAVAVGFALGVTHPTAGNMGGGGFMVVRLPSGEATAIDYREVAPKRASRDMYLDEKGNVGDKGRIGPLAAGIPGVVAGLAYAHHKYGKLPWADVVKPSIALAREGHTLDTFHAQDMQSVAGTIAKYAEGPAAKNPKLVAALKATAAMFTKADGSPYQAGEKWQQPDLATTLELIAKSGPEAFYTGAFAQRMASRVKEMGGIWTREDLANYHAIERQPVTFTYRGHDIITMPPPSAGGVVLRQILAASEALHLERLEWDSVERIHYYVEALRRTYADRNQLIGDPAFVDIPLQKLLDVNYIGQRMANIDPKHATPSSEVGAGVELKESEHTTHFSVVDGAGLAVANTYTLNGGFGAKLIVPGTGVLLNNEMDDFTSKVGAPNMFGLVQGSQNAIAPGKRMLSSMTPTVIVKDGKLRAIVGSPGGPTITTTVAQIIMQVIDHGRSMEQAVSATRVHHQWLPDQIWHEDSLPKETAEALVALGHKLQSRSRIGHANCIEVDPRSALFVAVADVARDGGKASAY
jgi:gamma-glutamyltranspeptidase / glutathione hydrolase